MERDGFEPSVWASTPSASEALPYLANALADDANGRGEEENPEWVFRISFQRLGDQIILL
jgi:hypothetical protein